MKNVTLDAHALIWYYHEDSNRELSQKAWTVIREAEKNGIIYVPVVVLMEIMSILEKGKYPISFDDMLRDLEENPAYSIIPLTTEVIKIMRGITKPVVIPIRKDVPVFVIKNNLRSAGMSREQYFELLSEL